MNHPPIITNGNTGTALARQIRRTIRPVATRLGWKGELIHADDTNTVQKLVARAVADGARHVIVCGGDGSVLEALGVLVGTPITLGIIPSGTGNLFARNLGLPLALVPALRTALHGTPTLVDVGQANGTTFGVIAGIGWDGAAVRTAHRRLKTHLGIGAYLVAALRNIRHPQTLYTIQLDDQPVFTVAAKGVMAANLGKLTPWFTLFPTATHRNGLLDIAVLRVESFWGWVRLCINVMVGDLSRDPQVDTYTAKTVHITCTSPQPMECDGNDFPETTTLSATCLPGAVTIFTTK